MNVYALGLMLVLHVVLLLTWWSTHPMIAPSPAQPEQVGTVLHISFQHAVKSGPAPEPGAVAFAGLTAKAAPSSHPRPAQRRSPLRRMPQRRPLVVNPPAPPVTSKDPPVLAKAGPSPEVAPVPSPPSSGAVPAPGAPVAVVQAPRLDCTIPSPSYPPRARRLGYEGDVVVRITVNAMGHIQLAAVDTSSGHPELDQAAMDTVREGHCQPFMRDGMALAATALQRLDFHLD